MNILGFDTCFGVCSAALGVGLGQPNSRIFSRSEVMNTGHSERLLPMINELLAEAELPVEHLDKIAVTCGPGSFTGVRISVAAARAFRLALEIPVVPFTSLEAIALNSEITDFAVGKDLVVAVDANRGECYVQVFDGTSRAPQGSPQLLAEKDFSHFQGERAVFVIGTAARRFAEFLKKHFEEVQFYEGVLWPAMSEAILRSVSRASSDSSLIPLYIREPDAKPQNGKTLARF